MRKPLMRIPYTELLAPPTVRPSNANTIPGAVAALENFFTAPPPKGLPRSTVVLTGAGLSVSSGLADYRGVNGTYRVNKTYRPIYYHEFLANHEARKRYWARSFLGWTSLHKASPNQGHYAVRDLGQLGLVRSVVTQNVDSFHSRAHPDIPTLELHGYLRSTVCVTCRNEYPRDIFQEELARLNPAWAAFLVEALASGALDTENPAERKAKGIRTNPDGDVDLPGAPYTTFRYPACPHCLAKPPSTLEGSRHVIEVDHDGAWKPTSSGGILKPAVVMFGESIAGQVKTAAEEAIDGAGRLLILGTSLATYSAWRLAKRALDRGMPIAIVNTGGVRGEDQISAVLDPDPTGALGLRTEVSTDIVLPALVERLQQLPGRASGLNRTALGENHGVFKDMLS
ncbi:Sir2 family protein [Colletotrichum graminicola]|uniref:Sir2 family protein n=1 Tax=Colletotrichum graminicola (strain M1.001 / M2 / FGSC 10212) TaxID=645133 RepID=E3Q2P1_COLGM|nr:Sir2 family protein [Colletotrichum graminicola M1.001]EFQ24870.1 Sir2 family protein [Colletotrichum graminicola M1.001]WDK15606.1 Sir2 family protein [Colletotrichum graminicola]